MVRFLLLSLTVTLPAPVGALSETLMFTEREVGLLKATEFTVMPLSETSPWPSVGS